MHYLNVYCHDQQKRKLETFFISFIKRFYLFTFRERGREGDREGEKY